MSDEENVTHLVHELAKWPRVALAQLPTPIHRLNNFGGQLDGQELWIKRDDLTGLEGGGNKTRKLEFLVADAVESGADMLVTAGAIQSNHTRQTAAAAAKCSMKCALLHFGWTKDAGPVYRQVGNILLSSIMGAELFLDETERPIEDQSPLIEFFDHLRVRPETLCRITEFSEHESNGRELDEGERVAVEVLPVLGQSAAAVEPGDGAFDHPTPGLDDEALHPIGSLDDLGLEIGQDAGQGAVKDRALIGAVGEQFPEKGKQTEQGRQQRETAVAILNVGGGDDAVQQQALRIDQNMPLLALDQLAGIEAVAVDASPPFSALFTL